MSNITALRLSRDYTIPAIDERIADLVKRRIASEGIPVESTKERLVGSLFKLKFVSSLIL